MFLRTGLFFFVGVSCVFAGKSLKASEKDSLLMVYLGKGTKLVVTKPIEIPANAGTLVFRLPEPNHYQDACHLNFEPSPEDRVLSPGREIVFSGKVLNGLPPRQDLWMSVEVSEPQGVKSVSCRNAWDGNVTVGKLRSAFKEVAELVFPKPNEFSE